MRVPRPIATALLLTTLTAPAALAQPAPPPVQPVADSKNTSDVPADVAGLLELDDRIRAVVEAALPAVVALEVGNSQGSGVVVSPDGLILSAGHVVGRPGQRMRVILPDGSAYDGVSLGRNGDLDSGLARVVDPSAPALPFVPLGRSTSLPLGTWTVALGHPGGRQEDRPPVVRVGRILASRDDYLLSDNTLVGGDSGGPLFDLDGRLIGIHSRIGGRIEANIHVPVDRYLADWPLLSGARPEAAAQAERPPAYLRLLSRRADDGLEVDTAELDAGGARVVGLVADGPADRAGVQINDRVVAFDGKPVANGQELELRRLAMRPGQAVTYGLVRGLGETARPLEVRVVPVRPEELAQGRGGGGANLDPDRPVLGINPGNADGRGVLVNNLAENGPARDAGLQQGDVIVAIDDARIRNFGDLRNALAGNAAGDTVRVEVERDGRTQSVELTLARLGDVDYSQQN